MTSPEVSRRPVPRIVVQLVVGAAIALLLWALADVFLLLFFAVLFACVLRGASEWLAARTGLPVGGALAIIAIALTLSAAGIAYWIAPTLAVEARDLVHRVTSEWNALSQYIGESTTGEAGGGSITSVTGLGGKLASPVEMVLGSTLSVIAGIVIIIVTALYLAASPDVYVHGFLHLIPIRRRPRVLEAMAGIGRSLQLWTLGQLVDMLTVGVLAAVGLMLVGVPAPYALGVLSGLLTFIPYFGAILAAVPAVLVALTIGWKTALWALGVYTLCHCVEGYLVGPLVQRRLLELPPALTVMSMTFFGTLFGVLGLALGTPLAATALVAVRLLYVEDGLEDHSVGAPALDGIGP